MAIIYPNFIYSLKIHIKIIPQIYIYTNMKNDGNIYFLYIRVARGFSMSVIPRRVATCICPGSSRSSICDRPRRTCEKAASHVVTPPAILNTGKRRTGDWIASRRGRKAASIRRVIIVLAFLNPAFTPSIRREPVREIRVSLIARADRIVAARAIKNSRRIAFTVQFTGDFSRRTQILWTSKYLCKRAVAVIAILA